MNDVPLSLKYKAEIGSGSEAPLALFVHGRAGNHDVMWTFKRCLPANVNIISPQAPLVDPIGGFSWWHIDLPKEERRVQIEDSLSKLLYFINEAINKYELAPSHIVAYGFSQGSGLLSLAMQREPELFDGVAILAGFVIKEKEPRPLNIPVIMLHGENDQILKLESANENFAYLQSLGTKAELFTDPVGHKVGTSGMKKLKEWSYQLLGQEPV